MTIWLAAKVSQGRQCRILANVPCGIDMLPVSHCSWLVEQVDMVL